MFCVAIYPAIHQRRGVESLVCGNPGEPHPANLNSKQGNQKIDMPHRIREKLSEYHAEWLGGQAAARCEKRLKSRA